MITKTAKVGKLNGSSIYKVVQVKLISFASGVTTPSASVSMLDEVKKLFEDGFYFSYGYDMTCSRQRRVKWIESKRADPIELIASDKRYFWNWNLSQDLVGPTVNYRWLTPLVQGYVQQITG